MFMQNLNKDLFWGDEIFGILADMIRHMISIETFPINTRNKMRLNHFSKRVSNHLI